MELALGKFGGGDGFTVVFDDDAAGEKVLRDQELVERTRKVAVNLATIGNDEGGRHVGRKRV